MRVSSGAAAAVGRGISGALCAQPLKSIAASKAPESTLAGIFLYFMVTFFPAFYRKDG